MKSADAIGVVPKMNVEGIMNRFLFISWTSSIRLEQMNPAITYQLPAISFVTLKVYDILGREVKTLVNEWQTVGSHSVTFDGTVLPSGVYLYRMQAGTYSETKKLVLMK